MARAHAPAKCNALSFCEPQHLHHPFELLASKCKLISALTCARVLVRKWVNPIQCFSAPKRQRKLAVGQPRTELKMLAGSLKKSHWLMDDCQRCMGIMTDGSPRRNA